MHRTYWTYGTYGLYGVSAYKPVQTKAAKVREPHKVRRHAHQAGRKLSRKGVQSGMDLSHKRKSRRILAFLVEEL